MNGIILRIIDTLILVLFSIIVIGPPNIPYLQNLNLKFYFDFPYKGYTRPNIESEKLYTQVDFNKELKSVFSLDYLDQNVTKNKVEEKYYNINKDFPKKSTTTPNKPSGLQLKPSDVKKNEEKKPATFSGTLRGTIR